MTIGERELKASPQEALEFLGKYAQRLSGALYGMQQSAERRLAEFAMNGSEKFGPDDLDMITETFRKALNDSIEAQAELDKLAPLKEIPIEESEAFLSSYDRLFPPSRPDDA